MYDPTSSPCLVLRVIDIGQSLFWCVEYAIGLLLSWSTLSPGHNAATASASSFRSLIDTQRLVGLVPL